VIQERASGDDETKRRVLIVDDNADAAELLAEMLGMWGCDARVAYDGHGAIEAASEWAPELVLLDIGLPDLDGFAVARELRSRSSTMRIVALSGYTQEADRERSRDAGCDGHLAKPVDLATLRALVTEGADVGGS
jgi:DNA-binding response OmpR family regulator